MNLEIIIGDKCGDNHLNFLFTFTIFKNKGELYNQDTSSKN